MLLRWVYEIDEENDKDSEETRPERSREPTKEAERTEAALCLNGTLDATFYH